MTGPARAIVLIGFMGTGKSEVGRLLANALQWKEIETDSMVEQMLGMPITEIFTRFGEERFRDTETAVLRNIPAGQPSVIITGGGAVLRAENVARMRELGTLVCLTADGATLERRLAERHERPLLPTENRGERIQTLLREREPHYREAAELTIDTSEHGPEEVATLILRSLAISD
jgi:shikimate kinase